MVYQLSHMTGRNESTQESWIFVISGIRTETDDVISFPRTKLFNHKFSFLFRTEALLQHTQLCWKMVWIQDGNSLLFFVDLCNSFNSSLSY